jgi:hypothetical protein
MLDLENGFLDPVLAAQLRSALQLREGDLITPPASPATNSVPLSPVGSR